MTDTNQIDPQNLEDNKDKPIDSHIADQIMQVLEKEECKGAAKLVYLRLSKQFGVFHV